jgi:putative ABC transport system substrate-binding protein
VIQLILIFLLEVLLMSKKTTVKLLAAAMSVIMAVFMFTGCARRDDDSGAGGDDGRMYNIGILQFLEHNALNAARQGFMDELAAQGFVEGVNVTYVYENAGRDNSTSIMLAQRLVDMNPDMILSIATNSSQHLREATEDARHIPVVFTAITNPYGAGLVADMNAPGANMTGMTDLYPIDDLFDFMLTILPDVKTVGIMYNSGEANSAYQAELARGILTRMGLAYVEGTVASEAEIAQVAESLANRVDVIYTPTCNTVVAAMAQIVEIAFESGRTPVFAADNGSVERGALGTKGLDYYVLGRMTGAMAIQILRGQANPATMAVQAYDGNMAEVFINVATAARLGITIPADILAGATIYGN